MTVFLRPLPDFIVTPSLLGFFHWVAIVDKSFLVLPPKKSSISAFPKAWKYEELLCFS
jgi:hypothetical protein